MSSCYLCYRSLASIRCLICREYFCLTCSGSHRHNHLLDALEDRLNSRIHNLPVQFDENFHEQYSQANEHLQSWVTEIRRQFESSLQYELEQFLKSQFELLKRRTDEYVEEYVQYFSNLRANVRYAKQRQTACNYDQERGVRVWGRGGVWGWVTRERRHAYTLTPTLKIVSIVFH